MHNGDSCHLANNVVAKYEAYIIQQLPAFAYVAFVSLKVVEDATTPLVTSVPTQQTETAKVLQT